MSVSWGTYYTHLRIDALFFGVLLAYLAKFRPEWFLRWVRKHTIGLLMRVYIHAGVAELWSFEETDTAMMVPGFTLMYLGFGCMLLFAIFHH